MTYQGLAIGALLSLWVSGHAYADGLVIHAAEIGVGKFHRQDNKLKPYTSTSAWLPYVLPEQPADAATGLLPAPVTPIVIENADESVTVFFSTLDELVTTVTKVSDTVGQPVALLNVHGHGLPGTMWFPPTADAMASPDCAPWVAAANGSDSDNYEQYYSPVSADEIAEIVHFSETPGYSVPCATGEQDWVNAATKNPHFREIFTPSAQVHFLSCVVGLGTVGDEFTRAFGALVLGEHVPHGRVETSVDLGLGDWSMPGGMGFWDVDMTPDQLAHANAIYPVDRKDAEVAANGTIRVATPTLGNAAPGSSGSEVVWSTGLEQNVPLMLTSEDTAPVTALAQPPAAEQPLITPKSLGSAVNPEPRGLSGALEGAGQADGGQPSHARRAPRPNPSPSPSPSPRMIRIPGTAISVPIQPKK